MVVVKEGDEISNQGDGKKFLGTFLFLFAMRFEFCMWCVPYTKKNFFFEL